MAGDPTPPPPADGLLGSLRQLGHTIVSLLHTRAEILVTELEEEKLRLRQFVILALAAGLCLGIAILLAVVFLVALFWDTHRLVAIGVLCLLFFAGGLVGVLALAANARARPRLFATTLEELGKDRDTLRPQR